MITNRRQFISSTLGTTALIGMTPTMPQFMARASEIAKAKNDNILVVIQLSGGNDGLNTVVPFGDEEYYKNRFTLAIGDNEALKIDDSHGFHPSLEGFSKLLEAGQLSIVNGVGYPKPNRSHFESMDLWHTAHRTRAAMQTGWIGDYLENAKLTNQFPCVHFGDEKQPLALAAENLQVPSVRSLEGFHFDLAGNSELKSAVKSIVGTERKHQDDLVSFIQGSTQTTLKTSQQIEDVLQRPALDTNFPQSGLGQKLKMVAQLIGSGVYSKVYYVTLDGFDTHSKQQEVHGTLLRELGDALAAFMQEMKVQGNDDRVLALTFSEFGRRVKENASLGTDHGAAAPVFVAGGRVNAGMIGDYPSLTDLDDGDLRFHTDYRQIYATVLENWLQTDSKSILGKSYGKLPLIEA